MVRDPGTQDPFLHCSLGSDIIAHFAFPSIFMLPVANWQNSHKMTTFKYMHVIHFPGRRPITPWPAYKVKHWIRVVVVWCLFRASPMLALTAALLTGPLLQPGCPGFGPGRFGSLCLSLIIKGLITWWSFSQPWQHLQYINHIRNEVIDTRFRWILYSLLKLHFFSCSLQISYFQRITVIQKDSVSEFSFFHNPVLSLLINLTEDSLQAALLIYFLPSLAIFQNDVVFREWAQWNNIKK